MTDKHFCDRCKRLDWEHCRGGRLRIVSRCEARHLGKVFAAIALLLFVRFCAL